MCVNRKTNWGKDKIKTELVICGNAVRHAVSFRGWEMACSGQEICGVINDKYSTMHESGQ